MTNIEAPYAKCALPTAKRRRHYPPALWCGSPALRYSTAKAPAKDLGTAGKATGAFLLGAVLGLSARLLEALQCL